MVESCKMRCVWMFKTSKNTCTIMGSYFVTTDETNDFFQTQQRRTFVWKIKKDV